MGKLIFLQFLLLGVSLGVDGPAFGVIHQRFGDCNRSLSVIPNGSNVNYLEAFKKNKRFAEVFGDPKNYLKDDSFKDLVEAGRISFNDRYILVAMDPFYGGESLGLSAAFPNEKIAYLNQEEAMEFEVVVRRGKLSWKSRDGILNGELIYVLSPSGRVFASRDGERVKGAKLQHSSFFRGPVASAGKLMVKDGKLTVFEGLSDSGHFTPPKLLARQFILWLGESNND